MMGACYQCALESKQGMCVCHLPTDILQTIMRHLSILDYISCRAVSKCWSSAFLLASEKTCFSQAHQRQPWFLLLDTNDSLEHTRTFRATSKLGNLADKGTIYDFDMPELHGAYVLLSKYGWLLLYSSGDLFFFHMFSRTRIDIPPVNVAEMWSPLFEITAPPTSPDCILFMIGNFVESHILKYKVKVWSCKDSSWNIIEFRSSPERTGVKFVTLVDGKWYCTHVNGYHSVIDVANRSWKPLIKRTQLLRGGRKRSEAILIEPTGLTLPKWRESVDCGV